MQKLYGKLIVSESRGNGRSTAMSLENEGAMLRRFKGNLIQSSSSKNMMENGIQGHLVWNTGI